MEFILDYYPHILGAITAITSAIIAITSFIKALKSEKRLTGQVAVMVGDVRKEMTLLDDKVAITRAGIVQGFKDAVVTKDIKVSINNQVKKVLDERLDEFANRIQKSEEAKTQLTYWALKILRYTAAYNKLTVEQQTELDEVLALIAEDEKIVDTIV